MSYITSGAANIIFYNSTVFTGFAQTISLNVTSGTASDTDVVTGVSLVAQLDEMAPAQMRLAVYTSGSIGPLLSGTIAAGERTISLSASAAQLSAAGLQGGALWKYAYLSVITDTIPSSPNNITLSMSATLNVTSTVGAVPAGGPGDRLVVRTQPPSTLNTNTQYTIDVDIVDSSGHRDVSYSGTILMRMYYSDGSGPLAGWRANAPFSTVEFHQAINGTVSFVVSLVTAHADRDVYWNITSDLTNYPQPTTTHTCHVIGSGGGSDRYLSFTAQPQLINVLGATIPNVVVSVVDRSGAVDTSITGSVTLQVNKADGTTPADTGSLSGTLVDSLSSGVATFDDLTVLKAGGYTLRATHTTAKSATSNVFYGVGSELPTTGGPRQNIMNDATVWRKTTGTSNPTFATPTNTELSYVNGDLASTNKVTVDGFRMTFPHHLVLTKVIIKAKVSTVASSPYWQLYTSTNTTTPTDGTWQAVKSFTPTNTNVTTVTWTFSTTTVTKGVWVTQNKNGGSSTCDWYSIQVFGHYVNGAIQFFDGGSQAPLVDDYIGVPSPFKPLSGAQTVYRTMLVKNNTSATKQLQLQLEPARSGGDTLADADNAVLLDESGKVLDYPLIVPAGGFGAFQVKYTIDAAANDNSGKHYMRINAYEWEETTGWIGTIWTGTNDMIFRPISGSSANSSSVGSYNVTDCAYDVAHRTLIGLWIGVGGENGKLILDDSTPSGPGSMTLGQITGVTPNTGFTRLAYRDDKILLTRNDSTTCYIFSDLYSPPNIRSLSTASTFSLPTAATGDKIAVGSDTGYFHILNGTSGSVRLYRVTTAREIVGNVSLASWLGSGTITGMWYDPVNRLIFVVTAVSGGTRKIAWYNSTTLQQVGTATNADRNTFECYGGFTQGTSYYLFFGARYLWRYASTSYSGGTEIKDISPPSPSTKGPVYSLI
jgi:hypothetical protein